MENFTLSVTINCKVAQVFKALTAEIPQWWTQIFEGGSNEVGSSFTVRFGESVFKTMTVQELVENQKVVWQVEDSLINIPGLTNQTEWINTTIIWELENREEATLLHLTHDGLHPEVECYGICSAGWEQFVNSLKAYLETGKGTPFLNS